VLSLFEMFKESTHVVVAACSRNQKCGMPIAKISMQCKFLSEFSRSVQAPLSQGFSCVNTMPIISELAFAGVARYAPMKSPCQHFREVYKESILLGSYQSSWALETQSINVNFPGP